jgi:hypothetical protein
MRGLVVGTGPSLRGQLKLIPRFDGLVFICNNCFTDIPTADVWLSCDPAWHQHYGQLWNPGKMDCWHWDREICDKYHYQYVDGIWMDGLYMGPENKISLGHCSGHQLLNLAANQYGCDEIVLIGHDFHYSAKQRHYFTGLSETDGEYPKEIRKFSKFDKKGAGHDLMAVYQAIADQDGLPPIYNATPGSALKCFPMVDFEDYLSQSGNAGSSSRSAAL